MKNQIPRDFNILAQGVGYGTILLMGLFDGSTNQLLRDIPFNMVNHLHIGE